MTKIVANCDTELSTTTKKFCCAEAGLLNKSSCSALALGVTILITDTHMIWSHFAVILNSNLLFNKLSHFHFRNYERLLSMCGVVYSTGVN
jgi:hypothetical protein